MHCVRTVTDNLYWVGANDHRLTLFENIHPIPQGVSYNAYLLLDEKSVLFDTVDWSACRQLLENLSYLLGEKPLDYLVINHMEPDHCALMQDLVLRYPDVKIVCNKKTLAMIENFFTFDIQSRAVIVGEMDTLCTGRHTFAFVMAPMVHWPEAMVSYDVTTKTLYSADAFGTFGALNGNLYADEVNFQTEWLDDARRYYTNIVGKYGTQVQALLKKAATLDIQTICPLHGPILKENLGYYIGKYMTWSSYEPEDDGVLVAYASIHGNTKKAAEKMKEILEAKGAKKVAITDLSRDDMAEAIEDAFRYDKLVLAAASYDASVFPCMETFLNKLTNKNYQNRKIAIIENGSWAPTAARVMKSYVEKMKKITLCEKTVTIKSAMKDADVTAMEELADELLA